EAFMLSQQQVRPEEAMQDNWHIQTAFMQLFEKMLADPAKWMEMQMAFWQDYFKLWQNAALQFTTGNAASVITADPKDRRFKDDAWKENVLFDFIKQSYLLASQYIHDSVDNVEGLDEHTRQKIAFYTNQFVDAMAPSNFLLTNPEVLRATLESGGENLVSGLEHVLEDLKRGQGKLRISMTDADAFEVGRNLATTPGHVIYQNELMQLIQYEPTTEKVHKTPLLVTPAWINKFYILDLKPENSFVRWATEQGYTVFIISWVNPDEKLARKTFDDYLTQGTLAALDAIEQATGEKSVATVGYCLGGTLLSCTLAYLAAKGEEDRIASATFLTTMVDFKDWNRKWKNAACWKAAKWRPLSACCVRMTLSGRLW
ncbi:MAG: alpha/beta fold hydrolase, partial [Rickettsiales bacterium]